MNKKLSVLIGITGLGWTAGLPEPNATEIVQRSTQETTASWNQTPNYSFVERDAESKHGGPSSVKTYEVLQVYGSPYNRLMAVGDQPLSTSEQQAEDRKLRNEIQKRERESERERTKRVEKYLRGRSQDRALLNGMTDAFEFKLVRREVLAGRDCWVFEANPKSGYTVLIGLNTKKSIQCPLRAAATRTLGHFLPQARRSTARRQREAGLYDSVVLDALTGLKGTGKHSDS